MSSNDLSLSNTAGGTISGTLLVIFTNLYIGDIGKTIVLATIGAITSYIVSVTLQYLFNRNKK